MSVAPLLQSIFETKICIWAPKGVQKLYIQQIKYFNHTHMYMYTPHDTFPEFYFELLLVIHREMALIAFQGQVSTKPIHIS